MTTCPTRGEAISLNKLTAEAIEEVKFRTMTLPGCPLCGQDHVLQMSDVFLGDPAPRYEVRITEVVQPESRPNAPTSIVRDVIWAGQASTDGAAKNAAYELWDEKYGAGARPESATVSVAKLDE